MGPQTAALLFGASFLMCAKEAHILLSHGLACGAITRSHWAHEGLRNYQDLMTYTLAGPSLVCRQDSYS